MMDHIYGLGEAGRAGSEATPLGGAIFQYMGTRPSARRVRYRLLTEKNFRRDECTNRSHEHAG
jgi:hypothetical protein